VADQETPGRRAARRSPPGEGEAGSFLASVTLPVLNLAKGTALDYAEIQEGTSVVPQ
jgi:hypothetical protein